jgi:hypothetical protein
MDFAAPQVRTLSQIQKTKVVGAMKEYKLVAWPDLPAEFRRTAYRRMVSELSQRHVTEPHLQKCSGVSSTEVRNLLQYLQSRELLEDREAAPPKPSRWKVSWPFHIGHSRVS